MEIVDNCLRFAIQDFLACRHPSQLFWKFKVLVENPSLNCTHPVGSPTCVFKHTGNIEHLQSYHLSIEPEDEHKFKHAMKSKHDTKFMNAMKSNFVSLQTTKVEKFIPHQPGAQFMRGMWFLQLKHEKWQDNQINHQVVYSQEPSGIQCWFWQELVFFFWGKQTLLGWLVRKTDPWNPKWQNLTFSLLFFTEFPQGRFMFVRFNCLNGIRRVIRFGHFRSYFEAHV